MWRKGRRRGRPTSCRSDRSVHAWSSPQNEPPVCQLAQPNADDVLAAERTDDRARVRLPVIIKPCEDLGLRCLLGPFRGRRTLQPLPPILRLIRPQRRPDRPDRRDADRLVQSAAFLFLFLVYEDKPAAEPPSDCRQTRRASKVRWRDGSHVVAARTATIALARSTPTSSIVIVPSGEMSNSKPDRSYHWRQIPPPVVA